LLAGVWSGVGNEVKGLFDALISGTQDWNAVLTDTLRSFSQLLLNAGFSAIGQSAGKDSLLGKLFGGFRANGGPVSPGKSYMVGERGPEMFVPSGKGSIVANRDLGGGTVINITNNIAEGGAQTNARGEGQSAAAMNQLSKMMVAVIQREQRPGGVLSRR
jgi:phage-related minor tail protein